MYLSVVSWVALLLEGAAAAPTWGTEIFAVKERHIIPQGWTRIASLPDSHLIDLRIGLRLQNPDTFQRRVMEVSDPSHARYGQYLSAAEIRSIVAPSEQSIDMVQSWLSDHGIHNTTLTPTGDWINVRLPVRKVETILNTTYSMYGHNDGSILVRTPEWSLPKHLHKHIDVIQPTTSFFRLSKHTVGANPERGPIKWHNKQWWRAAPNDVSLRNADFPPKRSNMNDVCSLQSSRLVISTQCVMSLAPILQAPLSLPQPWSVCVACMGLSITYQKYPRET